MKKIVYSLFLILTGVATLVSCQKDESDFSLSAVIADKPNVANNSNAKVYIENVNSVYYARWHNQDYVNINGQKCTLSVNSTAAAALINRIIPSNSGYTAVYPYSEGAVAGAGATEATVTIPASQSYHTAQADASSETEYQVVDGPMVAYCGPDDNVLKFHNAAGIIRVHVTNTIADTLKVHYVSVESSDGSYLAGSGTVSTNTETPSLSEITSNGSKSVTLDCCDDATDKHPKIAPSGSMVFYLAVAPFSGKQLKIKVMTEDVDDDGKYKYIFSSTTTQAGGLSLDRNQISSVSMSLTADNHQELLFYGAGTKDCPFLIESYDDLNQLRTIVNTGNETAQSTYNTNQIHYLQTTDINIGENTTLWGANSTKIDYSIGYNTTHAFNANFNGGNHSLTLNSSLGTNLQINLNYGVGIWGVVGGGGSISNVRAVGSISAGTRNNTIFGGIIGLICGDFNISNCNSSVNISIGNYSSNYEYNGGICGYVDASSSKVLFENCTYSGTLTCDQRICFGSIVAKIVNATKCTITSCSNTVKTITASYGSVGGLVGDASAPVSFNGCTNNWSITASGKYKVGGIIGNSTNTVEINGCTNNGKISCSGQVGGFVGYSSGKVTIKGTSANAGEIEGASTTSKAGGCIGEAFGDVDISGSLTNSGYIHGDGSSIAGIVAYVGGAINIDGSVSNSGNVYVSGNYGNLGGIVGYSTSAIYINKDCSNLDKKVINTGSLTSGSTSNHGAGNHAMGNGGIIGTAIGTIQIKNCYNEGTVSLKCSVGGIVGCVSVSGVSYIENCLNTGNIRGWVTLDWGNGGIVGDLACASNSTRFYIRNCGNEGDVITGKDGVAKTKGYAAGIVGFAYSNGAINLDITNCYSKDAEISGEKVGGILTGKYKSSNNIDITVSNCYFEGTLSGSTGAGSISYNDGSLTHFYYTYCYSDNTTDSETPTANESSDNKSSGEKKAARTFNASDGKYANRSTSVSSEEWAIGKLLVNALNSQVTQGNGYRSWVTPTGKVLPTLGL